jgi:hypothetical protein
MTLKFPVEVKISGKGFHVPFEWRFQFTGMLLLSNFYYYHKKETLFLKYIF